MAIIKIRNGIRKTNTTVEKRKSEFHKLRYKPASGLKNVPRAVKIAVAIFPFILIRYPHATCYYKFWNCVNIIILMYNDINQCYHSFKQHLSEMYTNVLLRKKRTPDEAVRSLPQSHHREEYKQTAPSFSLPATKRGVISHGIVRTSVRLMNT